MINKGKDMKRISQHLGMFACFRYIAVIKVLNLDPVDTISCGAVDAYVWYG